MSSSEWREVKLGDLVDSISQRHKFDKEKIVLVNTSDVIEGVVLNHQYVKNENLKGQFKKSFRKNDILYSEIRPKNKRFAYVDFDSEDYVASTKLMVLRKKDENITSEFLYQILKSEDLINSLQAIAESRSGTFPQITYNELSRMIVSLPPLPEQKAIAHILSTLDEKIEVNNQINKTLENIAQTIFKHWFVDFEFPNGAGEPYKSSGGEMVDSELGMIPKGWEVKMLKDITEFQNGYAFYKNGYSISGKKVIDLANVNVLGDFIETDRDKFVSLELYNEPKMEKYRLIKDDLVMIMTDRTQEMNILGKTGKIPYSNKYILNQRVGRIRINSRYNVNFIRSALNSDIVLDELKSVALGSVQKYVNTNHIKEIRLTLPSEKTMNKYSLTINPIYENMHKNNEENIILIKLRDSLLPKLMSGEIRVPIEEN